MNYLGFERKLYEDVLSQVGGRNRALLKVYESSLKNTETAIAKYRQDRDAGKIISDFALARQEALQKQIELEIEDIYKTIKAEVEGGFSDVYTQTYYTHAYDIERYVNLELPSTGFNYSLNFSQIPTGAAYEALNMPIAGHTFSERIGQDKIIMQFKIRTAVSQAIIEGQTRQQLTKALMTIDDTFAASASKAATTARTELLRAYSYGQDLARYEAEAAGVEFEYKWSSALDSKTRHDHVIMDSKKAEIVDGEPVFTLPDGSKGAGPRMEGLSADESINCRCRRLDLPYGIEPTKRVAKLPDGTWIDVPGNTTAEEWIAKNYGTIK